MNSILSDRDDNANEIKNANAIEGLLLPEYVRRLMALLEASGEEAYVVGGGLRDALLGKEPSDYDLATSASPERMCEIFSDFRTVGSGLKHGTLTVICDRHPIEITTFRVDGSYTDSRHPDSVSFTRSIEEDLARRDFTVNAMAYNERRGLIDLYGGREDLRDGVIRAVGDPERRFQEDALRILRAFRFSALLGFDIDAPTLAAAEKCRGGLDNIARERIGSEFLKLICAPHPERPLLLMRECGVLSAALLDYQPDVALIEALAKMPDEVGARLGFLLVDCDACAARDIIASLRCSNRQKQDALALRENARYRVATRRDAARLCSLMRDGAYSAALASVLLGVSDENATELVLRNAAPRSVDELAIGGRELCALGARGRQVGELLSYMLERTADDPSLNREDALLKIASEKLARVATKENKNV